MTLAELRQALAALPESATLTLPVAELREALNGAPVAKLDTPETPDRLLTADEAANRLGTSRRYVYQHREAFPFTRELPGGSVRFSERGLDAWLARGR